MKNFILFLALFATMGTRAQDGDLDLSFGIDGIVQTDIGGGADMALSITQQVDGKLLVAGMFTKQEQTYPSIVRYNLNGTLDNSFGTNAVVTFNRTGYSNTNYNLVLSQNDGKIIAAGRFYINSNSQYGIHRYLPDGSIDMDFGNDGELIVFSNGTLKLLDDDSLLVVGSIDENEISQIALKKFKPNGTLDASFGNNGLVTTVIGNGTNSTLKVALAQDNKIMVLANNGENSISNQVLVRYTSEGSLDVSFGNNGIVELTNEPNFSSRQIALYEDGKIAVSSSFYDYQIERAYHKIYRYLPNGSLDTSFGNQGYINLNQDNLFIQKIEVQQNNRLLVFGSLADFMEGGGPFFMKRYWDSGHQDTGFNFINDFSEYFVSDMLIQQDGKIICLGNTPWYDGQEDIIMERHVNDPLSTPEFEIGKALIFPNPSNGNFTLKSNFYSEKEPYQITDVTGKIILTGLLNGKKTKIDCTSIQSGVYFLKTRNSVFRLIKD